MPSYLKYRYNVTIRTQALRIKDFVEYDIKHNRYRHILRIVNDIKFIIENILGYPKDEQ